MPKRLLAPLTALAALALPLMASAQSSALDRARGVAGAGGLDTQTDAVTLVGNIISAAIGLLGVVLVILIIYAGFLYLTAGGDDDKVADAKKIIVRAIIGLVITMSAYAITSFVVNELTRDRTMDQIIDENSGGGI